MHCRFLCAGLLASVAAGIGTAGAADFPVRPGAVAPAVAPAYISEWAGFYVGINGGGGWSHTSVDPSTTSFVLATVFPIVPNTGSGSGGVFGFQFGHNWQWGSVVGGLEIDFDGADIKGTANTTGILAPILTFNREVKIDELASARGRLGWLFAPNWLVYGTAGIGWGHTRSTTNTLLLAGLVPLFTQTDEVNQFGWVAGAGVEWKFAEHWLLRGEWLHYDFAKVETPQNVPILLGIQLVNNGNIRTTVDVARAALSYKF